MINSETTQKEVSKKIVAITANVCEEKNNCSLCDRGNYYGIPLVFILHYEDKSINTVCYRCGTKMGRKADIKLPLTETQIYEKLMKGDGI